jgi:molybdate transport system regulatory protein
MADGNLETLLALRGKGRGPLGRDRIAMLEAVGEHGGVASAAKTLGLSVKALWDGLGAINNLLPRPAVIAHGRDGGSVELTADGRQLIAEFHRLEVHFAQLAQVLADSGNLLLWGLSSRTSARNAFRCQVTEVRWGPVNVEVSLRLSELNTIVAVVTNDSAEDLGLLPGREAVALVKSSFVMLARGDYPPRISARNLLWGTVVERSDGGVNSEIILDIGGGKSLTAVITRESADELPLAVGDRACAMFKASHVILAVD